MNREGGRGKGEGQTPRVLFTAMILLGLPLAVRAQTQPSDGAIVVLISHDSATVTAGEWLDFETVLRNDGAEVTPPLAAHLSIAALVEGKHVDPEDWSPQRTQYLAPLEPGQSMQLSWRLHVLFEGVFASFVTVVPADESFPAAVSAPLRLWAAPDNILPWRYVIPVVSVVPIIPLALLMFTVARARRRSALDERRVSEGVG